MARFLDRNWWIDRVLQLNYNIYEKLSGFGWGVEMIRNFWNLGDCHFFIFILGNWKMQAFRLMDLKCKWSKNEKFISIVDWWNFTNFDILNFWNDVTRCNSILVWTIFSKIKCKKITLRKLNSSSLKVENFIVFLKLTYIVSYE